jgi:Na+/melibiose symporter-like transporter
MSAAQPILASTIVAGGKSEMFIFPKTLYFVFNVMNYCLHTFQSQIFEERWFLHMKDIAFANMLQVSSFLGSLFWTWFADKTGHSKIIVGFSCVLFALLWALLFLPPRYVITESERIFLVCSITTLAGFFQAALFPIFDAVVMAILTSSGKFSKELFGRQRFFGAFGHYIATVSSDIIKGFGFGALVFLLFVSSGILLLLIVLGIPKNLKLEIGHHHHGPPKKDEKKDERATESTIPASSLVPEKKKSPLSILMRKPAFLFFLLFILIAGITRSFMTNYQNYFVERKFNRNNYFIVLATVRFFSEGAVYFFNQDLGKFLGYHWMLILSQVAAGLRSLGYGLVGFAENPGQSMCYLVCIPLELLKGLNSGLVTAGAVRIASDLAPPGGANTAQGLFTGIFVGFSTFVGGALSMVLFNCDESIIENRIAWGFNSTGVILLVFTLVFTFKYAVIDKVILFKTGKKI